MLTGKKEAVYLGNATPGDYAHGECRNKLIAGKAYEVTFGSNWVGSIVLDEIEADSIRFIDKESFSNDSTAFRYFLKKGFDADWLTLNK
jgi:hypothetical protein